MLGSGNFSRVYKGIWRGTVVVDKLIPVPSSKKVWENEINAYRYRLMVYTLYIVVHAGAYITQMSWLYLLVISDATTVTKPCEWGKSSFRFV